MTEWIPLMDYAMLNGVSLSTLRRHIKANKILYKLENGKYLLPADGMDSQLEVSPVAQRLDPNPAAAVDHQQAEIIKKLSSDLQKAQEEIAELKTLIAFYEEKMFRQRLDV